MYFIIHKVIDTSLMRKHVGILCFIETNYESTKITDWRVFMKSQDENVPLTLHLENMVAYFNQVFSDVQTQYRRIQ